MIKKLVIGSDHGGLKLKRIIIEHLEQKGIAVEDVGTHTEESCHYPIFAKKVAQKIVNKDYEFGILICGTGIGVSIAANKVHGIRAALCSDTYSAKMTRKHNNSNILCLGERVLGSGLALDIVDIWLDTEFEGGRHQVRIDMLED